MGQELDKNGQVKDPLNKHWETGSAFTFTPPGWWHSFNDSDEDVGFTKYQM